MQKLRINRPLPRIPSNLSAHFFTDALSNASSPYTIFCSRSNFRGAILSINVVNGTNGDMFCASVNASMSAIMLHITFSCASSGASSSNSYSRRMRAKISSLPTCEFCSVSEASPFSNKVSSLDILFAIVESNRSMSLFEKYTCSNLISILSCW
uniref:Lef-4 protein n=1 Tax=Autographa californica nuclear polyhedrosis virus TaxID=46015 RepID=Q65346_NPVAC|nr:16.7 kDa protein; putative [Autographa californica nucleopolyhedrovirus]